METNMNILKIDDIISVKPEIKSHYKGQKGRICFLKKPEKTENPIMVEFEKGYSSYKPEELNLLRE